MERQSEANMNGSIDALIPSGTSNAKNASSTSKSTMYTPVDDDNEEDIDDTSTQFIKINDLIKTEFMSYCMSFLRRDEESRQCVQTVWNKYLRCVGDVAMLSSFFDALPFSVRSSALPKYQSEVLQWYQSLFHIRCDLLLNSTYYAEPFLQLIRYVHKLSRQETSSAARKGIIYIPAEFDINLKHDLLSSLSFVQFEHCKTDFIRGDMIDLQQLEQFIQRDLNHPQAYPMMVIAQAGTTILGHCDDLTKIKQLCDRHNLWLHATGDLLGALALLSTVKGNVNISCDSFTMDTAKLLGIQNLPYLTAFIRPVTEIASVKSTNSSSTSEERVTSDNASTVSTNTSASTNPTASNPFSEILLYSPSISLLSVWSVSQRCTKTNVLYHMKHSLNLTTLLLKGLKPMKTLRIMNDPDPTETMSYRRICSGDAPDDGLPRTVVIFRFETADIPEIENLQDLSGYMDLLNLWLFDKLFQRYPKMNLELLKSAYFQVSKTPEDSADRSIAHAIRFAPLEHFLDAIDDSDIQSLLHDIQLYSDILLATMAARARLSSSVSKYPNLISIPMPSWAGIGAIRYLPDQVQNHESTEKRPLASYDTNSVQAELARTLQTNDSAFSLGGGGVGTTDNESPLYLRLGMIRKRDDLDVLLQKIADAGKETEISLKYVEDMAEKIKVGIEKVQQDLKDENQQLLAQEGLLRQLPVISNIMSWWSPSPSASPLATKGRSFDLNSGCVESTEDIYAYRMQIKKQSPHAPTHNEEQAHQTSPTTDVVPEE